MRLLFIRHAEPDYSTDSLTEKGWREAALLAKTAPSLQLGHCFVSPLGRAQKTAAGCLAAAGKTAVTLPWLEEFDAPVDLNLAPELAAAYPGEKPEPADGSGESVSPWEAAAVRKDTEKTAAEKAGAAAKETGATAEKADCTAAAGASGTKKAGAAAKEAGIITAGGAGERTSIALPGRYRLRRPWDVGPKYYAAHPELIDPVRWRESEIYKNSLMPTRYDEVAKEFDRLLASYGYVHENGLYRVVRESRETLTFFCHFGITCVLLSVLWDISPFFLWQSLVMLPSTVTELISEEREQGAALFRAQKIGDQSHLFAGAEEPSFYARFCEVYSDFSAETGRH